MKIQYLIFFFLLIVLVGIIYLMSATSKAYDTDCQFEKFPAFFSSRNYINLNDDLINLESTNNLEQTFPYSKYLSSDNWKKVSQIRKDLTILDTLTKNTDESIKVLSIALTNKMQFWNTDNLDSLNLLLNWTEKFNTKNVFSDQYDILYDAVFDWWMSNLSQRLDKLNQTNYSIKFNCKFNYLRMRCCQMKYGCGDRDDNTSKAIRHVIEKDWFYLFNRFWIGTSFLFKFTCLILVLITVYGYVCIIKKHFKNNNI